MIVVLLEQMICGFVGWNNVQGLRCGGQKFFGTGRFS